MSNQAFEPVPSPFNFAEAEHAMIRFWKEQQIYRESLKQRKDAPPFVFYEGPPTANGKPHPGHCLTRTIKDIFPRYKTMAGYFCERKAGWDTHGLPVEIEVCKELGIIEGGKAAIEEYGIERFNRACIESVFRYQREWEELTDRIGFWVDLEDAYVTYHQSYVESVWWALKTLFDRGLLYQGHKVVWWWAQGGTALSAGEVGEGYRDTDDPAITVSLTLTEESAKHIGISHAPVHLLVWTTTPWTLSSNCAACVGPDLDYALVKTTREDGSHVFYILAAGLVEKYFGEEEIEILRTMPGEQLLGLHYTPLFHYDTPQKMEGDGASDKHWLVIPGDFVDLATGTGIVHMAPAFGEDDYRVCKEEGIGFLCFVKPDGTFDARVTDVDPFDKTPIAGQFCKDADKGITRLLKERGQILRHETYRHPYPFCPRADQDPLIQYARKSWFIRTSQFVDEFVANNKEIAWQPEHIRDGRFGNFLENNVDWALSRERYWGTPLPVWICDKTGHMEAISNYDELLAKPDVQGLEVWQQAKAATPELSDHLRVHKPYIDAVHYQSPQDPAGRMRRVTEVIDVWFDAGSMPFAQWGYPHKPGSEAQFQDRFPADFISEAIDQTRGWFYALLAISTVVFGKDRSDYPHPFRNCICLGHILGEDSLKLSKRLKNYSEPGLLFEKFSADALRFSFIAKNPPTSSTRLSEKIVEESQRELLIRWYNVYSFFTIYANLDGFHPLDKMKGSPTEYLQSLGSRGDQLNAMRKEADFEDPLPSADAEAVDTSGHFRKRNERTELDRWILHELDRTILIVRQALDKYETYPAARAISDFLDALSNWYVRRSRARFWASGWSQDKADAYWTLWESLTIFARLAAPFTPFFSEVTWQNLAKPLPGAAKSVHLATYPEADPAAVDHTLLEEMAATREAVSLGLSARRIENIKVRQPLSRCDLILGDPRLQDGLEKHRDLITEELNVKALEFSSTPEQYVTYEVKPNFRILGPKYGKKINAIRQALATGDGAALFRQVQDTGAVTLEIDGETLTLTPEEVEVRLTAKEGFAAAQGKHLVAILATEITPELRREGWVRELIRFIQDLRKEQELAYDARINVTLTTPDAELARVAEEYKATIAAEVLAESFVVLQGAVGGGSAFKIEGSDVGIKIA
jgi:isoleucyl-tRNA synthetase